MTVTDRSFYHLERDGEKHYFCGAGCKARFAAGRLRIANSGSVRVSPGTNLPEPRWLVGLALLSLVVVLLVISRWFYNQ
jgi:hypothetical protein